jgi:hypothetical protein
MDYQQEALRLIKSRKLLHCIDMSKLFRALREKSGIPEDISL